MSLAQRRRRGLGGVIKAPVDLETFVMPHAGE